MPETREKQGSWGRGRPRRLIEPSLFFNAPLTKGVQPLANATGEEEPTDTLVTGSTLELPGIF